MPRAVHGEHHSTKVFPFELKLNKIVLLGLHEVNKKTIYKVRAYAFQLMIGETMKIFKIKTVFMIVAFFIACLLKIC